MDPPLTSQEVIAIIKSLKKKDYNYTCKASPIQQHCNAQKCRQCKHGIGGSTTGMPRLGSLTKLCTTPPAWFIDVEGGGRVELTTYDLQNFGAFQMRCVDALNIMPSMMKRDSWQEIVQGLLESVNVVDVPKEATNEGSLRELLEDFCTFRQQGKSQDEILLGKPWTDRGRTHFRLRDFIKYLQRQNYENTSLKYVVSFLKEEKAAHGFLHVKGHGVNVWHVKAYDKDEINLDVPIVPPGDENYF